MTTTSQIRYQYASSLAEEFFVDVELFDHGDDFIVSFPPSPGIEGVEVLLSELDCGRLRMIFVTDWQDFYRRVKAMQASGHKFRLTSDGSLAFDGGGVPAIEWRHEQPRHIT
jgi:hypothetical protein